MTKSCDDITMQNLHVALNSEVMTLVNCIPPSVSIVVRQYAKIGGAAAAAAMGVVQSRMIMR